MHNYFHFKDLENNTSYHQSKKEKKKALRFGVLTGFALSTQLL